MCQLTFMILRDRDNVCVRVNVCVRTYTLACYVTGGATAGLNKLGGFMISLYKK